MKIVIAIDSFKGSLSTFESGKAVSEGIKRVFPDADTVVRPLADGGEGTVEAIVASRGGSLCRPIVTGPLGESLEAVYGVVDRTAVIEMSAAAGLTLVPEGKRDPMNTTTYGVGEIIRHAIKEKGCRHFLIGIGGSATNDGGVGMLEALGFGFFDADGRPIERGARGLEKLARITSDGALPELCECRFDIACDVKNTLCGENGCSAVYGPQKGATAESIAKMDSWLAGYASLTAALSGKDHASDEGAGAAGGMGFAFVSYLGAALRSGIELVLEATDLESEICDADIVVTGEGRLDSQSCMGKAPVGVARAAKKHGKTVIAFAGAVSPDARLANSHGIDAFFPIVRRPVTLSEAMDKNNAYENLRDTAEQVFRLIAVYDGVNKA